MNAEEADRFVAATHRARGFLYRMARRGGYDHHRAEDIVQETYLRAFAGFAGHRGPDTQVWLATICRNVMRSDRRQRSRRVVEEPLGGVQAAGRGPDPADLAVASVEVEALRRALVRIPAHHQLAVVAMDLAGWSAAEVAAASGRPRSTVLSWSRRGRLKLAVLLVEGRPDVHGRVQSGEVARRLSTRTTPSLPKEASMKKRRLRRSLALAAAGTLGAFTVAAATAAGASAQTLPGALHPGPEGRAVFVQTNNLAGNQIDVFDARRDGRLSLRQMVGTGGLGGQTAQSNADHLALRTRSSTTRTGGCSSPSTPGATACPCSPPGGTGTGSSRSSPRAGPSPSASPCTVTSYTSSTPGAPVR